MYFTCEQRALKIIVFLLGKKGAEIIEPSIFKIKLYFRYLDYNRYDKDR